jgi:hypothetical protein
MPAPTGFFAVLATGVACAPRRPEAVAADGRTQHVVALSSSLAVVSLAVVSLAVVSLA